MESLRVYSDPSSFWDEVAPSLRANEAQNSLMLGLAYLFRMDPKNRQYQSALFSNKELLGAVICIKHSTNSNLVVSTADGKTIRKLFDGFRKVKISPQGIVGEANTADNYLKLFEKIGAKTRLNMKQGIYKCMRVTQPKEIPGSVFRAATMNDAPVIGKWIEIFHKEAVPHDPPVKGIEIAKPKIEKKMIFVLEKNGKLISMAGWGRDIETSCSINLVFTPKPWRRNGYASLITAKLTQYHLDLGKLETNLYTDMTNPTSNKIYQDIGYEFVCDSIHYGVL